MITSSTITTTGTPTTTITRRDSIRQTGTTCSTREEIKGTFRKGLLWVLMWMLFGFEFFVMVSSRSALFMFVYVFVRGRSGIESGCRRGRC